MVLLGDKAQVEACFGPLEIVLFLRQECARFAPNIQSARKSFSTHLMELLCDVGLVACFSSFGDSVGVSVLVHGLRQKYHRLRNHFGHTR
jgi:hypothetical protein